MTTILCSFDWLIRLPVITLKVSIVEVCYEQGFPGFDGHSQCMQLLVDLRCSSTMRIKKQVGKMQILFFRQKESGNDTKKPTLNRLALQGVVPLATRKYSQDVI
jgi:hypothetical protein